MAPLTYPEYLQKIEDRLTLQEFKHAEYSDLAALEVDRVFYQHQTSYRILSQYKICFIRYLDAIRLTAAVYRAYSKSCYQYVQRNRYHWLGGFREPLIIVFPLLVTDALSDETRAFVQKYMVRHWWGGMNTMEFPAVFDLSTNKLYDCISISFLWLKMPPVIAQEAKALYQI